MKGHDLKKIIRDALKCGLWTDFNWRCISELLINHIRMDSHIRYPYGCHKVQKNIFWTIIRVCLVIWEICGQWIYGHNSTSVYWCMLLMLFSVNVECSRRWWRYGRQNGGQGSYETVCITNGKSGKTACNYWLGFVLLV